MVAWRSTAAAVGVALCASVGLAGCPTLGSSFQDVAAEVELAPLEVPEAGAEIAVELVVDEAIAWQERTISVASRAGDGPVVVALVDAAGEVIAMAALGGTGGDGLRHRAACGGTACGEGFALRFAAVGAASGPTTDVAPTVSVALSGYDQRSPGEMELRAGPPLVPEPTVRLRSTTPSELLVDADQRVAGALVELPPEACGSGAWLVVLPVEGDVGSLDRPQVRLITDVVDVSVAAGRAVRVPDDVCGPDAGGGSAWTVLAAPVAEGAVTARWVLVGGRGVEASVITGAAATTTASAAVPLRPSGERVPSVALPVATHALHLVEGVDEGSEAVTGGGSDWAKVDLAGHGDLRRSPGTAAGAPLDAPRWQGSAHALLVVGPCPRFRCPAELDLALRTEVPGGPPAGARGRADVFHLLVDS